jgi:hypothetical protein
MRFLFCAVFVLLDHSICVAHQYTADTTKPHSALTQSQVRRLKSGSPSDQFRVAQSYVAGTNGQPDFKKAFSWYKKPLTADTPER